MNSADAESVIVPGLVPTIGSAVAAGVEWLVAATFAAAGAGPPVDAPSVPEDEGPLSEEPDSAGWRPRPDCPSPGRRADAVAPGSSCVVPTAAPAAGVPPGRRGPVFTGEAVREAWCPVALLPAAPAPAGEPALSAKATAGPAANAAPRATVATPAPSQE
ncbi:hypothetical protein ACQ86B_16780 [Mycolicibacterium aichiense]|uniref:hypothetical protein n=1 Tax=Mycolicibacterium aichiense TaxID=1799 RepID=UPI003D66C8C8